jgi:UrcA family protein
MFTAFTSTVARTVIGTAGMAFCAGICLVGATAPANAGTVRTATVSYADLNVGRAQGRVVLDRRLHNAARSVCSSTQTGPAARIDESRCVRTALSNARPVTS